MAQRHQVLMCPPEYFSVSYAINPWMEEELGSVSRAKAEAQWRALYEHVKKQCDVILMTPRTGLPDMVFTANAGIVYGERAIVSHFHFKQRQPEEPYFHQQFEALGFELIALPPDLDFEGAGDVLLDRAQPWVWHGFGPRTMPEVSEALRSFYSDREVIPLELVDPRFYHVDTCLAPLSAGHLLYFPAAFTEEGQREITARIPPELLLPVNEAEASSFACNAVCMGNTVIANQPSQRLIQTLEQAGYSVVPVDLSEFIKAGGSAKCLVLRLDEP